MTTSTVICDALQTPADFVTNLFTRQREDPHILNNNIHTYSNVEESMLRLKPQKSSRSLRSTKLNDKKPTHDHKGLKRRSNLSHNSNQIPSPGDIDSNVSDEPQSLYGNSYEGKRSLSYENDEFNFHKVELTQEF